MHLLKEYYLKNPVLQKYLGIILFFNYINTTIIYKK